MILFDTNILIYSQNKQNIYHKCSQSWLTKADTGEITGVLSSQNLVEFACVYLRLPYKKEGLAQKDVNKPLASFTSGLFRIIYPTVKTITIFRNYLKKYPTNSKKIFDLFLVSTMLSNGVTQILTYNEKDFIGYNEIEVISPHKPHEK